MSKSSTMFTIGTLLRHAMDAAAPVRMLVGSTWLEGTVIGSDGHGVVLDDGEGQQVLARLESVMAVTFQSAQIDPDAADPPPRKQWVSPREPITAGPVGG